MAKKASTSANTAAQTCANKHAANSEGHCSEGWCPYNRWPATWPENR